MLIFEQMKIFNFINKIRLINVSNISIIFFCINSHYKCIMMRLTLKLMFVASIFYCNLKISKTLLNYSIWKVCFYSYRWWIWKWLDDKRQKYEYFCNSNFLSKYVELIKLRSQKICKTWSLRCLVMNCDRWYERISILFLTNWNNLLQMKYVISVASFPCCV